MGVINDIDFSKENILKGIQIEQLNLLLKNTLAHNLPSLFLYGFQSKQNKEEFLKSIDWIDNL